MTQEEMQVLQQMFEAERKNTAQMFEASEKRMSQMMDEKLNVLKMELKEDIAEVKEDTAITRSATNSLVEWADEVAVITQIKFPTKKAK